jgi:hypothetical protein
MAFYFGNYCDHSLMPLTRSEDYLWPVLSNAVYSRDISFATTLPQTHFLNTGYDSTSIRTSLSNMIYSKRMILENSKSL